MDLSGKEVLSRSEELKNGLKDLKNRRLILCKSLKENKENGDRAKINQDLMIIGIEIETKKIALQQVSEMKQENGNRCPCGNIIPEGRIEFLKQDRKPLICVHCAAKYQGSFSLVSKNYSLA